MKINQIMKEVQRMQANLAKRQEELAQEMTEASAGGGMVTVTLNGINEVVSLKIDPAAVDPDDIEMLEDLVMAALNEAVKQVKEKSSEAMADLTAGLPIPPGLKIPGLT